MVVRELERNPIFFEEGLNSQIGKGRWTKKE
jgi:hypothetical protein